MPETILYEKTGVDNHVAIITLNRPEASNAINRQLRRELQEVINHFDHEDDEAWVAVITGSGRNFCAGRDLKERASDNSAGVQARAENSMAPDRPHMWTRPDKPLVAAVNGAAAAGGWAIAQMCDVRLAADTARLGITETKWSLMPPFAVELTKMIGIANVLELVMTAELLPAYRVQEMGFLNRVVPADDLLSEAVKMAESIAQNAPLAVRTIKDLAYSSLDMSIAEISAKTYVAYDYILTTEDSKEGPRAFAEKRRPNWQLK